MYICFFKQKTAYEMRISDWSSDVCSSDLKYRLSAETIFAFQEWRNTHGIDSPGFPVVQAQILAALARQVLDVINTLGLTTFRNAPNETMVFYYAQGTLRSEERRVGKECVSTCRSRWSPDHTKKKHK